MHQLVKNMYCFILFKLLIFFDHVMHKLKISKSHNFWCVGILKAIDHIQWLSLSTLEPHPPIMCVCIHIMLLLEAKWDEQDLILLPQYI